MASVQKDVSKAKVTLVSYPLINRSGTKVIEIIEYGQLNALYLCEHTKDTLIEKPVSIV